MTPEQHYEAMINIWGDSLPNPIQQPIEFNYYVKLYNYFHREQINS